MTQKVFEYNIDTAVFNKYSTNVVRIANVEVTDSNYNPINEFANVASVDNTGGYIRINGYGFAANAEVYYNVNTSLTTTSITSTQINIAVPAISTGNYNLYVQNPSGTTAFRAGLFRVGGAVNWTTGSSLGVISTNSPTSISLTATSDSALTYELVSGSLPPGLSLNTSTGVVSGNVQVNIPYTTYSFTIRAVDAEFQTNSRLFTLPVANTAAFSLSAAVSGKTTWVFGVDGPLDVPAGANLLITPNIDTVMNVSMWGAGGGAGNLALGSVGAGGGFARGLLKMYKANTYLFRVGSGGLRGSSDRQAGGGGGASGIEVQGAPSPLMVAGGGGGSWGTSFPPAFNEGRGGAGGGANGQTPLAGSSGSGGTQSAGGAAGTLTPGNNGTAGSYKAGGNGAGTPQVSGGSGWAPGGQGGHNGSAAGGGGGGGGYYGGGGGSYSSAAYGGGGGSGYIHPTEVLEPASNTGNFQTAANTNDALRGTRGDGGTQVSISGVAGRIWVTYAYNL